MPDHGGAAQHDLEIRPGRADYCLAGAVRVRRTLRVKNEAAVYQVLLQPFMCHCRAGERKRLHVGLGEAGRRSTDRSCRGGPRQLLMARQEGPHREAENSQHACDLGQREVGP